MQHIFACRCGTETKSEREQVSPGEVFQCPKCLDVFGHLRPNGGGRAWILLSRKDVKFHNLLGQHDGAHDFRCDNCDNGVELEWNYCAWCGATKDWVPAAHGESGAKEG